MRISMIIGIAAWATEPERFIVLPLGVSRKRMPHRSPPPDRFDPGQRGGGFGHHLCCGGGDLKVAGGLS